MDCTPIVRQKGLGEVYELCIIKFTLFVREQVYLGTMKTPLDEEDESIVLGQSEFSAVLKEKAREAIRYINKISGQVPDKESSQI